MNYIELRLIFFFTALVIAQLEFPNAWITVNKKTYQILTSWAPNNSSMSLWHEIFFFTQNNHLRNRLFDDIIVFRLFDPYCLEEKLYIS